MEYLISKGRDDVKANENQAFLVPKNYFKESQELPYPSPPMKKDRVKADSHKQLLQFVGRCYISNLSQRGEGRTKKEIGHENWNMDPRRSPNFV
jgi:hypothetical protein